MKKGRTILGGVVVLTLAGVLVKITGVVYKIPLTYLLGDEGMGYFNAAYTVYSWLYMLSTAGFPVALSILVSDSVAKGAFDVVRSTIRKAGMLLVSIGILGSVGMLVFAPQLAALVGAQRAAPAIRAIAPALIFICITSLFRGVFQGYQCMGPTAISQIVEACGKVALGLGFAYVAASRGYALDTIAAYAIFGVTVGTVLGTIYLVVRYLVAVKRDELSLRHQTKTVEAKKGILRRIVGISIPVTIGASVMALTTLIDLVMMIRRLQNIGYSAAEATAIYGNYTALVVPMFNLPSILITPIASGIIPAISAMRASNNILQRNMLLGNTYRVVSAISIPCAFGLCFLSRPILGLLYPASSAENAYRLLSAVSPAVTLLALLTVSNAVLQAMGRQRLSMWGMAIGSATKIGIGYLLLGIPGVAALGAPIGTVACYLFALAFSLASLSKTIGYTFSFWDLIGKPSLASLAGIGTATFVYQELFFAWGRFLGIFAAILLSVLLYGLCAAALGVFSFADFQPILSAIKRKRSTVREV